MTEHDLRKGHRFGAGSDALRALEDVTMRPTIEGPPITEPGE